MKELSYLNKYFVKYKYSFSLGIIFTIIAQIFMLFTPKLISQSFKVIEEFSKDTSVSSTVIREELISNVLLIVATTIVAGLLTFLMRQTLIVMSRHIEFDLKNEVFRQYENLSQNFYKQSRTGDLMNRISEDVSKVRMYVGPAVMYSINTIIRFAIVIIYMYNNILPWQKNHVKSIYEMKYNIPPNILCKGLPEKINIMLVYCYSLEYTSEPNYEYIRFLFETM